MNTGVRVKHPIGQLIFLIVAILLLGVIMVVICIR